MAKTFEYKLLQTGRDDQGKEESILNELGKKGWEIVQFETHTAAGFHVWLKREIGKEV
jgi:hypothetical protein